MDIQSRPASPHVLCDHLREEDISFNAKSSFALADSSMENHHVIFKYLREVWHWIAQLNSPAVLTRDSWFVTHASLSLINAFNSSYKSFTHQVCRCIKLKQLTRPKHHNLVRVDNRAQTVGNNQNSGLCKAVTNSLLDKTVGVPCGHVADHSQSVSHVMYSPPQNHECIHVVLFTSCVVSLLGFLLLCICKSILTIDRARRLIHDENPRLT